MDTLSHQDIKELRELRHRSVRQERERFLVEGPKLLEELEKSERIVHRVVVTEQAAAANKALLDSLMEKYPVYAISERMAAQLSETVSSPGIFAVAELPKTALADLGHASLLACFVDIQDPGNVGTMIRTAEWFGVEGIVLSGKGADPFHEKVMRSSMGSVFRMPVYISPGMEDDLKFLKREGFQVIATDVHGSFDPNKPKEKRMLVMGNESKGLSPTIIGLADSTYTIPGKGPAESLNVGVSFGIILHDLTK